jgi:hypothetical protein
MNSPMSTNASTHRSPSDDDLIRRLERISAKPYESHEEEWQAVLEMLNLPVAYLPGVQTALRQGSWQGARKAAAYVATVAYREARKAGILGHPDKVGRHPEEAFTVSDLPGIGECDQEKVDTRHCAATFGDPLKTNGKWRISDAWDGNDGSIYDTKVHASVLKKDIHGDEIREVDWDVVAAEAALTQKECKALKLRLNGIGRDSAIQQAASDAERRAIEAGFKGLQRKQARISEIIQNGIRRNPHRNRAREPIGFVAPALALKNAYRRERSR